MLAVPPRRNDQPWKATAAGAHRPEGAARIEIARPRRLAKGADTTPKSRRRRRSILREACWERPHGSALRSRGRRTPDPRPGAQTATSALGTPVQPSPLGHQCLLRKGGGAGLHTRCATEPPRGAKSLRPLAAAWCIGGVLFSLACLRALARRAAASRFQMTRFADRDDSCSNQMTATSNNGRMIAAASS